MVIFQTSYCQPSLHLHVTCIPRLARQQLPRFHTGTLLQGDREEPMSPLPPCCRETHHIQKGERAWLKLPRNSRLPARPFEKLIQLKTNRYRAGHIISAHITAVAIPGDNFRLIFDTPPPPRKPLFPLMWEFIKGLHFPSRTLTSMASGSTDGEMTGDGDLGSPGNEREEFKD